MKELILLVTLFTGPTFAQDVKPEAKAYVRSELEKKAYEEGQADVRKQREKEEADKKKAAEDAESKRRASFVTSSVVDVAGRELLSESKKKEVKEAKKLMEENQKLEARLLANYKRLEELNRHPASVVKIAPDGK